MSACNFARPSVARIARCSSWRVPHWLQKRMAGSFSAPQAGQTRPSPAPQPPQNFAPAGFSVPQLEQTLTVKSVTSAPVRSRRGQSRRASSVQRRDADHGRALPRREPPGEQYRGDRVARVDRHRRPQSRPVARSRSIAITTVRTPKSRSAESSAGSSWSAPSRWAKTCGATRPAVPLTSRIPASATDAPRATLIPRLSRIRLSSGAVHPRGRGGPRRPRLPSSA